MRLFKNLSLFLFLFSSLALSAQVHNPVKWKEQTRHVSGNDYELVFTATIEDGWYVYSQDVGDDGPIPTTFEFDPASGVQFVGKPSESGSKKSGFDPVFKMNLTKFAHKAVFRQKIKVEDASKSYTIKGLYEFMTCNNERCLAPTLNEFVLKTQPVKATVEPAAPAVEQPVAYVKAEPATGVTTNIASSGNEEWTANGLPVRWKVQGVRVSKDEYDITFSADIKDNWELYSRYTGSKGPMPLTFEYENGNERIKPSTRVATDAGKSVRTLDNQFGVKLTRYQNNVSFTQRIKIEKGSRAIKGDVYYVAAQPSNNTILSPQRVGFSINLPSKITPTEAMIKKAQREKDKLAAQNEEIAAEEGTTIEEEAALIAAEEEAAKADIAANTNNSQYTGKRFNYQFAGEDCSGTSAVELGETSNLWVFLLGFGSGLLALLTPCIFPMIPITVGFFTKRSGTRAKGIANALAYGLSIIAIYVTLGLAVTAIFGAETLNAMSVNLWFNLVFFAVFVAFAFSFFGFYELTLPSSWSTWSDEASDKGGLLGIFFMAFTLSLVSFSCTGPIIGTLLAQTAAGGGATLFGHIPITPLLGMLGFSTALALPFALFAMFPAWLNSLPKSGGWMNTVKVTLGFLELALALKFLSVADLVNNFGLLKIELFLGLWIVIFLAMAGYMLGLYKLPLDYVKEKVTKGRLVTGLASLAFVGYLAYGLVTYEPLKVLSGLAPPVTYNFFRNEAAMEYPHCPQGIRCFKDYDEALAFAKQRNLPIMIDFTGHGCVNCRKMEETVWSEPEVKKLLGDDYVLVSLYVDERKRLDEPYRTENGTLVRDIGGKWTQFQLEHFNSNSQPLYVLITPDEKVLNKPSGYDNVGNKELYLDFLECGLSRWEAEKK